jgi:hypothetical protein
MGSGALDLSPRNKLSVGYQFQHVTFDRDGDPARAAFLEGGYSHSPNVRLAHTLSRRVSVGGAWQYRHAIINGGQNVFDVQDIVAEARMQTGPNTTVGGSAGAAYLSISGTGLTLWGPSFRGSLEHQLGRTSIFARYSRTFVPSFSIGGLTGNQDMAVGATTPLTASGRLVLSGSTTYMRTQPVQELGLGFQVDSVYIHGSIGYQVAPWLRSEGFVSSMHQTSTARGNIDRTRIGVQFVTSKPVRIE